MSERELAPRGGDGGWLYVALGCGGLLLVGLCLIPPAVVFLGWESTDEDVEPVVTAPDPALEPDPIAPVDPTLPRGVTPPMPAPPSAGPTSPRTVTVRITESSVASVPVGSTCSFEVGRHSRNDGTFWCQANIECGGRLLYGGGTAGYFDCTLYEQPQRHVVGQDFGTSGSDTDAAFRIDTLRAEMEIRDDPRGRLGAFLVRGTVTSVQ